MKHKRQCHFNKTYFLLALAIFLIEIYIALYVRDTIIRPYIGDYLVVILMYCLLQSFWQNNNKKTALYVLIFAFAIEFLQYLKFIEILKLQDNKLARIIIGTSFSWEDIIAYTLGILTVLAIEHFFRKKQ
jgi:hypothetical protein